MAHFDARFGLGSMLLGSMGTEQRLEWKLAHRLPYFDGERRVVIFLSTFEAVSEGVGVEL